MQPGAGLPAPSGVNYGSGTWGLSGTGKHKIRAASRKMREGTEVETYEVAEVGEREGAVWLSCTNGQAARELLAELRQRFPQWRVRPRRTYTSGSGDETGWLIDKCEGAHRYALWWLIRQFGARGWEPFSAAQEPYRERFAGPLYSFRKTTQT